MAHAGGTCKGWSGDFLKDDCEADGEIFHVAEKLPKGVVDAIVAGHTHKGVSEIVNGIPIIESFSYGKAFGRIDFTVDVDPRSPAKIVGAHLYPPQGLCSNADASVETCEAGAYEGSPVERDADVTTAIAADVEKAKSRREESLGVVLEERVRRDHERESEEGNLFTDLLRKAHPDVTVSMMNGGGLRADLPSGPLKYGALYEAFPFDNKTAIAEISGADLIRILSAHFHEKGGVLSVSGIRVRATCDKDTVKVDVTYDNGKKVGDKDKIVVLASDFMMTGGDSFWGPLTPPKFTIKDEIVRDTLETELRKMKTIKPSALLDSAHPRMSFPGVRPVRCKE
jgi:5'-nucleotidase